MSSVDKIMIPVTIVITFIAIIPFIAPGGLFENFTITTTQDTIQQPTPSQKNDSVYFQVLSLTNIMLLGVIFIHKKDN